MNQPIKQLRLGFFEKFITIMIIIKKEYQLSKISSAVLVTIPYFQLLILILQQRLTKQMISDSIHFQLVRNFIRPDIWIIEQQNINLSLLFIIVLVVILYQKIKLIIIVVLYYYILNQENLLATLKNNLILKAPITILSFYQQSISLFLFQWFSMLIACSLKNLLDQIRNDSQFIYFFMIFILLLTLAMLILEIFFNIRIMEKPITQKINGLERKKFNSIRIFSLIIEFTIQFLYIFQTNPLITLHLLVILSISKCLLDLIDVFYNFNFVNQLLINFLLSVISFVCVVYILIEFVEIQNKYSTKIVLETLILTPPLIQIIYKHFSIRQKNNLIEFFSTQNVSQKFINHLINIVNFNDWDFCTIHRALIQAWHYKSCTNLTCPICNHMYILDSTSAQGITIHIYKDFILSKLKFILEDTLRYNFTDIKGQNQSKTRFFSYVLLLYDFGWTMQSLQYLYQLKFAQTSRQEQAKNQQNVFNTLPKTNSYSDRNSHYISDNQTVLTAQQNKDYGFQFQINILINQIKFDLIEQITIEIILDEARRIIQKNFGTDDSFQQQSITSDFVAQYLINEVQVDQSEKIIAELTKQKIQFYENILKQNFEDQHQTSQWQNQKNFYQLIGICKKFKDAESNLLSMFSKKPSFLLHQSINIFYCILQNDYEKALEFSKNQQFLDERLNKFLKIKNFNVNSKDIHYLIMSLQDDMQHLSIISHSPQLYDQFGVLKKIRDKYTFEDLVPAAVYSFHHLFVRQFLEVGICKFFRMFETNFITGKDSFLEVVYMNVDVTELYNKNNLTFSVFMQKPTEDLTFIIVDSDKHYCQLTKNLLLRIGWSKQQILWFQNYYNLNQFPVENIIPDFNDILESLIKLNETSLTQIEFNFPKPPDKLKSEVQFENLNIKTQHKIFEKQHTIQTLKYLCDIFLSKRQIYNHLYYVIQISYIQKYQNQESNIDLSASRQRSKVIEEADFDSEIDDLDNNNLHQIVYDYQKQIRDSVTSNQKNTKLFSNYPTDPIMEEILSPGRICLTDNKNTERKSHELQDLISNINKNKQQQQFFINERDLNSQSSCEQINSQISQRKARQSRTKTLNEISKESLYRKYDTIHKILKYSKPKFFYQLIAYSYLFFFTFSVIPIFTMIEFSSDLNLLIEQIEMLQLHASIMGPHDLFFSMRITVTSYQIMYREGFLTAKELQNLTQPFLQYLPLGYQELQDNFYTQLNNPYLASFLNDVNIQVWYMGENSSVITPQEVTFRDNLFIMLQYQQQQLSAYKFNRPVAGQPFQVFLIANYLIMQNTCESLTAEIKTYSEWKCNQIYLKWAILQLSFSFLLIILLLLIYQYQRKFFDQYNSFIHLLKHNNDDSILNEISRYKLFLNQLSYHNIDEFNLEREYKKVISLQAAIENTKQTQLVYTKYKQFYPQIKNNIANVIVLILMIIYGIVVFAEADYYLSKYNITTDFFKLIQELKFRGGNGFLYRELFFRFNTYPFLTKSDLEFLYNLLARSQQVQDDFNSLISSIDYDKYLITQDFIDLLEYVQVNQMCTQVQEKFKPLMDQYCGLAFEGILQNGIIPALNYLHNQIITQQQMNNFTKRVEMHKYELEGSQIITRAFFTISDSFRQSFKEITNKTINSIDNLSISYLVISGFIVSIMIIFYQNYLINQYNLLKKIVYFVPLQIFLQDGYLERNLKEILIKQM